MGIIRCMGNGKCVGYFPSFWEFYFCAKWLVYVCMVTYYTCTYTHKFSNTPLHKNKLAMRLPNSNLETALRVTSTLYSMQRVALIHANNVHYRGGWDVLL